MSASSNPSYISLPMMDQRSLFSSSATTPRLPSPSSSSFLVQPGAVTVLRLLRLSRHDNVNESLILVNLCSSRSGCNSGQFWLGWWFWLGQSVREVGDMRGTRGGICVSTKMYSWSKRVKCSCGFLLCLTVDDMFNSAAAESAFCFMSCSWFHSVIIHVIFTSKLCVPKL